MSTVKLLPNQPAFLAQANPSLSGNTIKGFATIRTNQGSHYDNSNGRFTAPVGGLYLFYASIWPAGTMDTTTTYLVLKKNGSEMYGAHGSTNRQSITFTATVALNANQYVDLERSGSWTIQGSTPRNFYGGHLIG